MKTRAPSYQQLYLWVPLQATNGLADGHNYVGDINLDSEKAYESRPGTRLAQRAGVRHAAAVLPLCR